MPPPQPSAGTLLQINNCKSIGLLAGHNIESSLLNLRAYSLLLLMVAHNAVITSQMAMLLFICNWPTLSSKTMHQCRDMRLHCMNIVYPAASWAPTSIGGILRNVMSPSVCPFLSVISPERQVIKTSNLVKMFSLARVTDVFTFGQKVKVSFKSTPQQDPQQICWQNGFFS